MKTTTFFPQRNGGYARTFAAGEEEGEYIPARHYVSAAVAGELLAAAKKALDVIHSLPWDRCNSPATAAQDALIFAIRRAEEAAP